MDKIDWTNDLVLDFIELYESYPVLWNPEHKDHKNRNILNDAWQNIAKEIGPNVSVVALRKKKESLMTTYRSLTKKVRDSSTTGSGAMEMYEPTWFAFDAIDRFISSNKRKIPSLSLEAVLLDDEENTVQHNIDPLEIETNQDVELVIPKKRGRGDPSQAESNDAKHLKHASDVLTSIATKSPTQHVETLQDTPALYGQLLAAKLRRLPKRTRLVVQNQIDNLVFQAELEEIDSATSSNNYVDSALSPLSTHSVVSSVSPHYLP